MAATNKCLAQSNKSGTGGEATKKRDAAHRARPRHRQEGQARALPMERMTEHDMIGWFNAAPMRSRQQRMLWAAQDRPPDRGHRGQRLSDARTQLGTCRPPSLRVLSSTAAQGRARLPWLSGDLALAAAGQTPHGPAAQRERERRVDESSDGADGRPTIKTRDRLLKRLIAVHGEPRFDLFNSRRASCSPASP